MMVNKAKCKVLHLDCGNPKLGGEWIGSTLRKRTLWVLVDEKLNMSWQLAAHKSGQQCKGGDSAPSHCSCETPHKHSDLDYETTQERHGLVRASPKEGH